MKSVTFSLLLSLVLLLSTPGYAAPESISKQEAVSAAQQHRSGRVLSVKRNGPNFRVKTLNKKGEVRVIRIDAKSGKVISGR